MDFHLFGPFLITLKHPAYRINRLVPLGILNNSVAHCIPPLIQLIGGLLLVSAIVNIRVAHCLPPLTRWFFQPF